MRKFAIMQFTTNILVVFFYKKGRMLCNFFNDANRTFAYINTLQHKFRKFINSHHHLFMPQQVNPIKNFYH